MVAGEAPIERSGGGGAFLNRFRGESPPPNLLGILSFETAKAMSRLISLYMSVTDDEIRILKTETVRSVGVAYLNSGDEAFLLGLARSERLEDLDRAAGAVARLGSRCSDRSLNRFDLVYSDLKQGVFDSGKVLEFQGRSLERIVVKMERYVCNTASLFAEMEGLRSMEAQELKIQQWKAIATQAQVKETNLDLFEQKIGFQRKEVRRLKKISLWSKTFDKCVSLMARVVCTVFARIESVLGPEISEIPEISGVPVPVPEISRLKGKKHHNFHIHLRRNPKNPTRISPDTDNPGPRHKSGPLQPPVTTKPARNRFWSHELSVPNSANPKPSRGWFWSPDSVNFGLWAEPANTSLKNHGPCPEASPRVYQSAPPTTVGGAGLALRYANLIMVADRYLNSPLVMDDEQRSLVYEMLSARLRSKVGAKLRSRWGLTRKEGGSSLAAGWREAVEGMLTWLAPVAVDTLRWQAERNLEKQNMDSRPTVLLLHTLHYSDLEKTEAVLVEVLVGLSFIFKFENQQTLFQ